MLLYKIGNSTLAVNGFVIASVAPFSEPASTSNLEGTIAAIVMPVVAVAMIALVVSALLLLRFRQ